MKFRLLAGTHVDERGRAHTFDKGKHTVIESDEDLAQKWKEKFEPVHSQEAAKAPVDEGRFVVPQSAPAGKPPPDAGSGVETPEDYLDHDEPAAKQAGDPVGVDEQPLGEDVTSKFPEAEGRGLRVFKSGRKYAVAHDDDPSKQISPDDLTTQEAVHEFVGKRRRRHQQS